MPRHASEDYARLAAGLTALNTGRVATETYANSLFGTVIIGAGNRLATEEYVDLLDVNPPQAGTFIDTFARVDFPSLGGDWLGMASGEFAIVAAQAAPGVDTYCVSIRDTPETSGNHRASVRIAALGDIVGGPIVRAPDALGLDLGTTAGFYVLTVTGALSDIIAIRRHAPFAAGMEQLGALVTATPVVVGDTLRLEAEGDQLRGYLNGTLVITRTDATIPDSQTVTGMYANKALLLRVSRFESSSLGVTTPPVITAPGAPTGVTAVLPAGVPGAVTVSWAAPAATGGSPILGYRILCSPGGRIVDVGLLLTRQIDSLTAGTAYTFTVAARNTVGYGPPSAATTPAVTPTAPTSPTQPGTSVFRAGNWWERPLPANAPLHPSNRLFLQELNSMHAVNGLFAGGPVNANGNRYVALTGGADAGTTSFDTPIYRVSAGTSYVLTKMSGAFFVPPEFLTGGAGLRIPEVAKTHFLLGGAQSSDAPMLVIDTNRGYYANLAKTYWNANLGRWEVHSGGAASVYYTSSYGHDATPAGWPSTLTQYQDDARNGGFRGNNPMIRVIDYDRMVTQVGIPYVTELFATRTANTGYHVFPMTGHENTKGGVIGHGVRLRLKPSLTDAEINTRLAATLSGNRLTQAVHIAKAWRDYGCVVGDNSGSGSRVKVENFTRRGVPNTWDVLADDLKTFSFHPDTGDWQFIADEYFPPVTGAADTTPPAVPAKPSVNETPTAATISWLSVPDAATYKVYKDEVLLTTTSALSYVDTAVTVGATYVYKVSARDAALNESAKSLGETSIIPAASTDTTAPSVPTGLTATAVDFDQINLAWTASTDAVGVVSYRVRRAGVLIATVTSPTVTYQNTGLTASTTYSYTVAAVDAAGNQSAVSLTANATTNAAPTGTAPGVPPGVTAYMTSSEMVTVKWGASTGTTAAKSYKIYRSAPGGGAATLYVGICSPVSGTGFNKILTATGLAASTLYSFAVSAVAAGGAESAKSATVNATTAAAVGVPTGNVQVCYMAGDIAISGIYNPNCHATGNIIDAATDKQFVILLGDNAYSSGTLAQYNDTYHPAWGGFKTITYPCPGNHDSPTAYTGYKGYFGTRVPAYPSYYSYTKGNWLFLSLDSNVPKGSTTMAAQIAWIQSTIVGRPATIKGIAAYWHHARYTSTTDPDDLTMTDVINKLGEHNVDVVFQGHDHHYERFAKLNSAGTPSSTGMRFFVVGSGGSGRRGLKDTFETNSEQIIGGDTRGVLQVKFADNGYSWRWKGAPDAIYADGGTSTTTKPNPSTGDDSGYNAVNPR